MSGFLGMGDKLPRPGYLHPCVCVGGGGGAAQRQLHPQGTSCPGWWAGGGGGQDTPGSKLPRVQDKPVHRETCGSGVWVMHCLGVCL